ncbi:MAG: ADP-heptose--lipooligosaccharide heptosyltransferase [Frankiales bacterium]|nr:ADP-heptose--lipooligosaccharide heptosyltransferase [Frankiales bacterium]
MSAAPVDWRALRRVLAVRLDNLGDVVMVTPALRALRAALSPGATLDLLASPAGAALAPLLPDVDDVRVLRAVWQDASGALPQDPARELELVASLRGYDAVVVFTSFAQSPHAMAYAAYLAGVPVRVGVSKEFGGSVLSHWLVAPPDEQHQSDRALALLESVGVPARGTHLHLDVPEAARAQAAQVRREAGLPDAYAVLAPGASCPSRRYPPERFAAVARDLGLPVAVVGTEKERDLVRAVGGVDLSGRLDVPGLVAMVAGARVAVTNNSGGMHLADAVGTPVVALFAGTEDESQFTPRSAPSRLLRVPTPCAPCRLFACPYVSDDGDQPCLDVDPAAVVAAGQELAA